MIPGSAFREEEMATPDFSVNVSKTLSDVPVMTRCAEAARRDPAAVDLVFPHEIPSRLPARRLRDTRLTSIAFNVPGGASDGAAGRACDPDAGVRQPGRRAVIQRGLLTDEASRSKHLDRWFRALSMSFV